MMPTEDELIDEVLAARTEGEIRTVCARVRAFARPEGLPERVQMACEQLVMVADAQGMDIDEVLNLLTPEKRK